jgi:hypothetical protein
VVHGKGRSPEKSLDSERSGADGDGMTNAPICGATHPVALHTDYTPITCTLSKGHKTLPDGGDVHLDHTHAETHGEIIEWSV